MIGNCVDILYYWFFIGLTNTEIQFDFTNGKMLEEKNIEELMNIVSLGFC